ncbi:hypothetical protein Gotri_026838, partial [Gossypium trilobum]|nr:hypothetical protein [Gossypium trilobum]
WLSVSFLIRVITIRERFEKCLALGNKFNDNIPRPREEGVRSIEEYIEQLEEKKMHLRLDVDVQKLETEKLRKGKNKAEKDLDSLKIDYKKLRLSMKTAGLGKTSE